MSALNENKLSDKTSFNEKSKNAARERREKENVQFVELAKLLPLPTNVAENLNKAAIVKLTTSYLKMKDILFDEFRGQFQDFNEFPFNFIQSYDGFFMAIDFDGKIAYVSETITEHLGLAQLELMGSSIFEYIHAADHDELMAILSQHLHSRNEYRTEICFVLRMRCTLAKRNAGLIHGLFKVIHFNGHLKINSRGRPTLLVVAKSLPSSPSTKITLYKNMFMFRAGMDLRLSYLDDSIDYIQYKPQELMDKSLYECIHIYDIHSLRNSHHQLLLKGQSTSKYYRFLCKNGGYVWMQSQMSIVYKFKGQPHSIVAVNHVLSNIQEKNCILSDDQKKNSKEIVTAQEEIGNSSLPTTIILEDNHSEVTSSTYSYSSEMPILIPIDESRQLSEYSTVQNGFIHELSEEQFLQEASYRTDIPNISYIV